MVAGLFVADASFIAVAFIPNAIIGCGIGCAMMVAPYWLHLIEIMGAERS